MTKTIHDIARDEKGFTLVELAVVMIIIGLLVGGVLKGQEMIANAQVTSTVAQIKSFQAASNTFEDKYNGLPGDLIGAQTRVQNCTTGNNCFNGDGDTTIDQGIGAAGVVLAAGAAGESSGFFKHLLMADLVTGMDGTNPAAAVFGNQYPTASVGGGYTIGGTGVAGAFTTAAEFRTSTPYLVLTGSTAITAAATGTLTPSQAAQIDRKIDDGVPSTGSVIGENAATCRASATAYNEVTQSSLCNIAIRVK